MAELKVSGRMSVKKLKENFKNEFGGTLRVYDGREKADDNATLASIRRDEDAKGGELICQGNRTVGRFECEMLEVFGIKVQVATPDDYTLALDGITLASLKSIPEKCSKADMESLVAYKRKASQNDDAECSAEDDSNEEESTSHNKSEGCTPNANGHEYVDLGLPSGILWATCNVGASSPEEYGDYFAWGETKPKAEYNWETYKWCENSDDELLVYEDDIALTKYCIDSDCGDVDDKTILELSDDAANANWGGDWRMPTAEEIEELRDNCTWDWIIQNGVNGYSVTGPNGNSIFLPAAGYRGGSDLDEAGSYGGYWSSSLASYTTDASHLFFDSDYVSWSSDARYYGRPVRPVLRK